MEPDECKTTHRYDLRVKRVVKETSAMVKRSPRVSTPYILALTALFPAYLISIWITGQRMLAVAVAASICLFVFIVYRLIQLRGKLTLSITVIVIPLLAAVAFAGYQGLNPFIKRQQSISLLRDAGITYRTTAADGAGEWKRDRNGNMLPVWLANRIGPDCMNALRQIDTSFGAIQSTRYRDIDTSDLRSMELSRVGDSPRISEDFIDWVNGIPLERLRIGMHSFSEADADSLAVLTREFTISLYQDDQLGDLSALAAAKYITIHGSHLTPLHAEQLAKLNDPYVDLQVNTLSADAIRALSGKSPKTFLRIMNARLDANAWEALSRVRFINLRLDGMDVSTLGSDVQEQTSVGIVRNVNVNGKDVAFEDIRKLIGLFRCTHFTAYAKLTREQIDSLWSFPQLENVRFNDGTGPTTYTRD